MVEGISIFYVTVNEKHPLELKQGITIATIIQDKKGHVVNTGCSFFPKH